MNTAIVTGSSMGVGYELTKRLLREGWRVITMDRSGYPVGDEVGDAAANEGRLERLKVDLGDADALHTAIDQLLARAEPIDVLFSNAGVSTKVATSSKQGRDLNFEINTLAPYVLATRLVPLLKRGQHKTIVNVSSNAQLFVKKFQPAELVQGTAPFRALLGPYAWSKLALSLWTKEAAADFESAGIEIRSVCPGPNQTPMTDKMWWWTLPLRRLFFTPPSVGAGLVYDAAFGAGRGPSGVWLNKGKPRASPFAERGAEVLALVQRLTAR